MITSPNAISADSTRTAEQHTAEQHIAQQRQILAMMAVPCWVRREVQTQHIAQAYLLKMATANERQEASLISSVASNTALSPALNTAANPIPIPSVSPQADSTTDPDAYSADHFYSAYDTDYDAHISLHLDTDAQAEPQSASKPQAVSVLATVANTLSNTTSDLVLNTIAPFTLQACRYRQWVLLVDVAQLNESTGQLWHNILAGLSIQKVEDLHFPLMAKENTIMNANASLLGLLSRVNGINEASTEQPFLPIAVLTALPKGLAHESFQVVPSLEQMALDNELKKAFWRTINQ